MELFDSESLISVAELSLERAKSFARYVSPDSNPSFELGECYKINGSEIIVVTAKPQVPQRPINDIRYEEPLAVRFGNEPSDLPEVVSMREDFPQVPHLNLSRSEFPKSLCLFAERREDLNLRWTPALLGERILWWLRETAYGTLHKEDQSLEPFIGGFSRPLILPPDIFTSSVLEMLMVYSANTGEREILIADRLGGMAQGRPGQPFLLFPFQLPVQEHGIIRAEPVTLYDLDQLCQRAGYDLAANLKRRLQEKASQLLPNAVGTILVVGIPKARNTGQNAEATDVFGFRCQTLKSGHLVDINPVELGITLEILGRAPSVIANSKPATSSQILFTSLDTVRERAKQVRVPMLSPEFKLTAQRASVLSGQDSRNETSVLAVGMGALGSQVFENLARQGWGQWTLVDSDYFAPHNAVRHAILGSRFGLAKAVEMATQANQMFDGIPLAQAIVTDVLTPLIDASDLEKSAETAELILDMSASVAVSRHLALDWKAVSKRASLFLSPSGLDLVAMAEDGKRTLPLDVIELQYLRALLKDARLEGHFGNSETQSRYSGGCRDLTSHISQESVALHAAIGASAVRRITDSSEAVLNIWRCHSEEMTVTRVDIALSKPVLHQADGWTIIFDEDLKRTILGYRSKCLPRETCGALLGYLDMQRKRAYICQALPAPADSVEELCGCERGVEGMEETLKRVGEVTMNQVTYIGEWHSHPDNVPCKESKQDKKQMQWLTEKLHPEGRPALMLIACQNGKVRSYLVSP